MTWERVQTYARNEGIAIGEQRGRQETAIENAKNFLKMNILTVEQISQGTGLSVEEVNNLANKIENSEVTA